LQERFTRISGALNHPAQREKLAAQLKKHSQTDDPSS
jgi:hypothetical protein